jgi:hypothetical protein
MLVLAFLWYRVAGRRLSDKVDATLWRRLFVAMAGGSSLLSVLLGNILALDTDIGGLPDQLTEVPSSPYGGHVNPLDRCARIALRAEELKNNALHIAAQSQLVYGKRETDARHVHAWLESELVPLVLALSVSAGEERERLGHLLLTMDGELSRSERAVNGLGRRGQLHLLFVQENAGGDERVSQEGDHGKGCAKG